MLSYCAGVNQYLSTFWSLTLQPLGAHKATIPQMKGDIHSFYMRHRRLAYTKGLQSYRGCLNLNNSSLVSSPYSSEAEHQSRKLGVVSREFNSHWGYVL